MKILNTQAGLGGNRKLWGDKHEITAVELDPRVAAFYQAQYPDDTVIAGDAYAYVEKNFREFDFIWGSPMCTTHGQYRHNVGVIGKGFDPVIPDMRLYGLIIFLQTYHKGLYAIENVVPYYKPLVEAKKIGRHLIWSNFDIEPIELPAAGIRDKNKIADLEESLGISLQGWKLPNKRKLLRNCTEPALGAHVLRAAEKEYENVDR